MCHALFLASAVNLGNVTRLHCVGNCKEGDSVITLVFVCLQMCVLGGSPDVPIHKGELAIPFHQLSFSFRVTALIQ